MVASEAKRERQSWPHFELDASLSQSCIAKAKHRPSQSLRFMIKVRNLSRAELESLCQSIQIVRKFPGQKVHHPTFNSTVRKFMFIPIDQKSSESHEIWSSI